MNRRDEDDTEECPYCRHSIYEDAVQCPHCGNYLSREDAPRRHPWWILVGAVLCLIAALWWVVGR